MKTQEVLDKTAIAQAQLEWTHDIGIAAALDVAMKRVKDWERLKEQLMKLQTYVFYSGGEKMVQRDDVLRLIAEMENEDDSN